MVELLVGPVVVVAAGSKTVMLVVLAAPALRVLLDKGIRVEILEHWVKAEQQVLVEELVAQAGRGQHEQYLPTGV